MSRWTPALNAASRATDFPAALRTSTRRTPPAKRRSLRHSPSILSSISAVDHNYWTFSGSIGTHGNNGLDLVFEGRGDLEGWFLIVESKHGLKSAKSVKELRRQWIDLQSQRQRGTYIEPTTATVADYLPSWLDAIKALPGWEHPYKLMPGYPLQE